MTDPVSTFLTASVDQAFSYSIISFNVQKSTKKNIVTSMYPPSKVNKGHFVIFALDFFIFKKSFIFPKSHFLLSLLRVRLYAMNLVHIQ